jgi:hypothetical protein
VQIELASVARRVTANPKWPRHIRRLGSGRPPWSSSPIAQMTSAVVQGWSERDVKLRSVPSSTPLRDQVVAGLTTAAGVNLVPFFERIAEDERLRRCVGGKTVTCRVWRADREWFGDRFTSECWTEDGRDVSECMVRAGWATDYTCYSDGYYKDLETEAKNKWLGLWSCDNGAGTRRWGRNGPGAACETPLYKPTGPAPR